jgi:phosphoglycolate phosphatase-like HAD superfamily hydrolase
MMMMATVPPLPYASASPPSPAYADLAPTAGIPQAAYAPVSRARRGSFAAALDVMRSVDRTRRPSTAPAATGGWGGSASVDPFLASPYDPAPGLSSAAIATPASPYRLSPLSSPPPSPSPSAMGWAQAPPIVRVGPDDIDAYMMDGPYDLYLESISANALRAIDRQLEVARRTGDTRPPIVVVDVDDTVVSQHRGLRNRFVRELEAQGVSVPPGFLPPLWPIVRLVQELRRRGVRIAILTGRHSTSEAVTLANLRWVGIDGWDHAIFRRVNTPEQFMPAAEYKSRQRRRLADAGYNIVANIGDQYSDIQGPHSGVAVKLPNPMYVIP